MAVRDACTGVRPGQTPTERVHRRFSDFDFAKREVWVNRQVVLWPQRGDYYRLLKVVLSLM